MPVDNIKKAKEALSQINIPETLKIEFIIGKNPKQVLKLQLINIENKNIIDESKSTSAYYKTQDFQFEIEKLITKYNQNLISKTTNWDEQNSLNFNDLIDDLIIEFKNFCKNGVRYNDERELYLINKRLIKSKKSKEKASLKEIGEIYKVERETIRQQEERILHKIDTQISEKGYLLKINELFMLNKIIILTDETYSKIEKYIGLFELFFNIDLENKIVYKHNSISKEQIFNNTLKSLEENVLYTFDDIKLKISENIKYNGHISDKQSKEITNIFTPIFIKENNDKKLVTFHHSNGNKYIYVKDLNKNKTKKIKLNYWFKICYPNGVALPQENNLMNKNDKVAEIGLKKLEPLFAKIPEYKTDKYRSFITNSIINNEAIISYSNGKYIHEDYIKILYNENKDFIDIFIKKIYEFIPITYNSIDIWSIFKPLQQEFINCGINTHNILYNLIKYSKTPLFKFSNNRSLIIIKSDTNIEKLYEGPTKLGEKRIFPRTSLNDIIVYLKTHKFKSIIDFDLHDNTSNEQTLDKSSNNIPKILTNEQIDEEYTNTSSLEKETIVKRRIGQNKLRQKLLETKCECELCGIKTKELLVASHIKSWKDSNNDEKIDLENVLLLCSMHDALFDKGLITFDEEGKIIISKYLDEKEQALVNINKKNQIEINTNKKHSYMKHHRENHFINF